MQSAFQHYFLIFLLFTIPFIGGAAFLMGRALAKTWRSVWWVVPYSLLLGLVDRFLVFALFEGELLSVLQYIGGTCAILCIGLSAYRLYFVSMLVNQYPWIYQRTTWVTYINKIKVP
ncbi:MAG: hypothetical protein CMM32_01205 [Rhodospirillaceae bacterium]|nr:hypothetical protein [Rhodospirillaceae bacterium]|tara:strand:- start:450 stop:800 length:351 start_codon:yes stop_codon:yes gene_type:complete